MFCSNGINYVLNGMEMKAFTAYITLIMTVLNSIKRLSIYFFICSKDSSEGINNMLDILE